MSSGKLLTTSLPLSSTQLNTSQGQTPNHPHLPQASLRLPVLVGTGFLSSFFSVFIHNYKNEGRWARKVWDSIWQVSSQQGRLRAVVGLGPAT